jgi:transposase
VEVVSRDRATAYAQAAREAAPKATQVADRFHLLMNLRGAVERSLARQSSAVKAAFEEPDATPKPPETKVSTDSVPPDSTPIPRPAPHREQVAAGRRQARQERFDRVRQMHRDGVSQRTIAKTFRLSPLTVQRYVRAEACPVWRSALKGVPAPSPLDPFREHLERKVADGIANARALFRDLRALGYPGGYSPVRKAVHRLTQRDRRAGPRGIPHTPVPLPPPRPPIPSARRLSFAVARRGDTRSAEETRFVERLTRAEPGVKDTLALAERFTHLVRAKNEPGLDPWLADATASDLPEFRTFATSLRQDEAAVRAGLSLPWSNGPVEGAVNRLKVIKRSMYGRAGFDLLKARVLRSG